MPVFTTAADEKILVFPIYDELHVEAYHLANLLGYSQQHAIRKQALGHWRHFLKIHSDYQMVHLESELARYEDLHEELIGPIRAIKPERGRMFFSASGLRKVFEHTSKVSLHLELALEPLLFGAPEAPAPPPPEAPGAVSEPSSLEERRFSYRVLEQLRRHLEATTDPGLRKLAVLSAELAIGRNLDDVREFVLVDELRSSAPARGVPDSSPARDYVARHPISQGPLFDDILSIHYGLKQIGEKAGGYAAVQAGKAADIVAARLGHSHDDIRTKQLPFNSLPKLPDNTSGKLRHMYRYDANFSNLVVVELRSNSVFVPQAVPDPGNFSSGTEDFPNLSRGPLEGN